MALDGLGNGRRYARAPIRDGLAAWHGRTALARPVLARMAGDAGLAQAMAAADAETIVSFVATNRKRSERVAAFARSGSAELTGMLADALRAHWLSSTGVSEDDLDDASRRDLAFVIGGIVAVLGDASVDQSPESVAAFFNRPLGRGAAEMMNGLATLRAS